MPNYGELINSIALQTGVEPDHAALKSALSNQELTKIQVPDELATLLTENYKKMITLEAAKHNPDLKRHFFGTALSGIDSQLDKIGRTVFELPDEKLQELKKIEDSYVRINKFGEIVKEVYDKKAPPSDDEKLKKLNKQISDLNQEILNNKAAADEEKKKIANEYADKYKDFHYTKLFQDYEYTDTLPKQVQIAAARALFEQSTQANNYKVAFDAESGNLRLMTDADTVVHINNKPVDIKQYISNMLSENKMLKISAAVPGKDANGQAKPERVLLDFQANQQSNKALDNTAYLQEAEQALREATQVTY